MGRKKKAHRASEAKKMGREVDSGCDRNQAIKTKKNSETSIQAGFRGNLKLGRATLARMGEVLREQKVRRHRATPIYFKKKRSQKKKKTPLSMTKTSVHRARGGEKVRIVRA